MIWGGLGRIKGGKTIKNCDIFTVSTPRKSFDFVGLLTIVGISKHYGKISDGRSRSPLTREFGIHESELNE